MKIDQMKILLVLMLLTPKLIFSQSDNSIDLDELASEFEEVETTVLEKSDEPIPEDRASNGTPPTASSEDQALQELSKLPNEESLDSSDDEFDSFETESPSTVNQPSLEKTAEKITEKTAEQKTDAAPETVSKDVPSDAAQAPFEIGPAEQELIELSKVVEAQVSDEQWQSIAAQSLSTQYVVQKGDWLFKISKKLFGSGFYYPKIWAINAQSITNPHEIEPGMVLVFDPGSAIAPPSLEVMMASGADLSPGTAQWFEEKKRLIDSGAQVNSASQDLGSLMTPYEKNQEYKIYQPDPVEIKQNSKEFDHLGIQTQPLPSIKTNAAYYLNTYVTSQELNQLATVSSRIDEGIFLRESEVIFLKWSKAELPSIGATYSLAVMEGEVSTDFSERTGQQYTIVANINILKAHDEFWQAKVVKVFQAAPVDEQLLVTDFVPPLENLVPTFNSRQVDGHILAGHQRDNTYFTVGDVVFIDRGKSDGLEIGNQLQVVSNKNRNSGEAISYSPSYVNAQLMVYALSDHFATAKVIQASRDITVGDLVTTKSITDQAVQELAARGGQGKRISSQSVQIATVGDDLAQKDIDPKALGQEMNRVNQDIDALRSGESSLAQQHDDDALLQMESDLKNAQALLNDEEEQEGQDTDASSLSLDRPAQVERAKQLLDPEAAERKHGQKYADDQLNTVDNPYGLTPYDVEEANELLSAPKR